MNSQSTCKKNRAFVFLLLLIGIVYSNTLDAEWHLDDYHNILNNPWVHIDDLYPETLKKTFFASHDKGEYRGENIYRPAAMLSFAFNWYFGKDEVTGYHLVNIVIHILAAFFLFLSVYTLLDAPNVREQFKYDRYSIALLPAVLWAIHPIQIQAVTYIVQRMASMAGMFFIAAIYTYLKARLTPVFYKKILFVFVSLLLFVLAISSKQNAAILPLVIVVIEYIFFQDLQKFEVRKLSVFLFGLTLIFVIAGGTFLFLESNVTSLLQTYSNRPFTLWERLITEARVVLFYLYQLFYPVSSNFSIAHDITLSTSVFSPWTTLPAIFSIILILIAAFLIAHRIPLLSFAVIFFFLNHIIESSIIPLELVFEHRNYIPSMFLFVPISSGICVILDQYKNSGKPFLFYTYSLIVTGLVMVIGIGTYTRNFDWLTEKSFWDDALIKAPDIARPYQNLAVSYYSKIGDHDTAIELLEKSIDLKDSKPNYSRMIAFHNLSKIYVRKNEMIAALDYAEKAVNAQSADIAVENYIKILIQTEKLESAIANANRFIESSQGNERGLELKTIALIKMENFQDAEKSALKLIKKDPFNTRYLMYFGLIHSSLLNFEKADYYLSRAADRRTPDRLPIYLSLINNSINAGFERKTFTYMERIFKIFTIHDIRQKIAAIQNETYPVFVISIQEIETRLNLYLEELIRAKKGNADEVLEEGRIDN
jgi:tetratricopeptide (TPR) repeat protein